MRFCDGCGSPKAGVSMGGAILCKTCDADVQIEIAQLRKQGQPVNVLHIARRMFRDQNPAPGTYLLRDIPPKLWSDVEHRAVDEQGSVRDVILGALFAYLKT